MTNAEAAVWAPYQVRPGRRVLVATDRAGLRGPVHGTVVLPLRLYWSPAGRAFDLDDPYMLRTVYEVVLQESLHQQAAVALRTAARHGFALGGGNALIAHGVIERPAA